MLIINLIAQSLGQSEPKVSKCFRLCLDAFRYHWIQPSQVCIQQNSVSFLPALHELWPFAHALCSRFAPISTHWWPLLTAWHVLCTRQIQKYPQQAPPSSQNNAARKHLCSQQSSKHTSLQILVSCAIGWSSRLRPRPNWHWASKRQSEQLPLSTTLFDSLIPSHPHKRGKEANSSIDNISNSQSICSK